MLRANEVQPRLISSGQNNLAQENERFCIIARYWYLQSKTSNG
jgi:hypothetical protein